MQKIKAQAKIVKREIIEAVNAGLSSTPKRLPSWLLYDQKGDELFQLIMRLPEYYPTRCEFEILKRHKEEFAHYFMGNGLPLHIVELGAGDGIKTQLLLDALTNSFDRLTYSPVDISSSVLRQLERTLSTKYPGLNIEPLHGSYDHALTLLNSSTRNVLLFLGANIGNMTVPEATAFVSITSQKLFSGDLMVIGFDLKKDPRTILAAYDDTSGVTREFNLNLLQRINATLAANFDLSQFTHYPTYNPETGTAYSYLVSLKDQNVYVQSLNGSFHFSEWETIHTEISQKFDLVMIEQLLTSAGLQIVDLFFDQQHYFCDVIAVKA